MRLFLFLFVGSRRRNFNFLEDTWMAPSTCSVFLLGHLAEGAAGTQPQANRVPALLTVGTTLPCPRASFSSVLTLSELTPVMKLRWGFTNRRSDEMCMES